MLLHLMLDSQPGYTGLPTVLFIFVIVRLATCVVVVVTVLTSLPTLDVKNAYVTAITLKNNILANANVNIFCFFVILFPTFLY